MSECELEIGLGYSVMATRYRRREATSFCGTVLLGGSAGRLVASSAEASGPKTEPTGHGETMWPQMAQCEQRARGRATDRLDRKQLGQLCETPAANCRNLTSDRTAEKPVAVSRARRASAIRDGQTAGRSPTDRSPRQTQIA